MLLFLHVIKMFKFLFGFYRRISRAFWTWHSKRKAVSCGNNLKVNYRSHFSGKIYFGNNCNFNGMRCVGGGQFILAIISIQVVAYLLSLKTTTMIKDQ